MNKKLKHYPVVFFCLCLSILAACNQKESISVAYSIAERDLIPEGITYSSTTQSFYLSSIHKSKIIQIDAESGQFKDFNNTALKGLAVLGLWVDDSRGHLWACANGRINEKTMSAVAKFELNTGVLIKRYDQIDIDGHTWNDLVLDAVGTVYFTDTDNHTVYTIHHENDTVDIFLHGAEIAYPNGITLSPDEKYLYVASTTQGIRVIDLAQKVFMNEADTTFNSYGLDGLKYYKNSLIGLQNQVRSIQDRKISRYALNTQGTDIIDAVILEQDNPHFDIPTTFVIVKDKIYLLANSQMANLSGGQIRDPAALKDVIILKIDL